MRENRGGRRVLGFQEGLVPRQLPARRRQSGLQGGRSPAQRNNASDIFKSCFSGLLEALLGTWRQHGGPSRSPVGSRRDRSSSSSRAASLPTPSPLLDGRGACLQPGHPSSGTEAQ